jgi:hypothetical protein
MLNPNYFNANEQERNSVDSIALAGLELAFEAHRERSLHGESTRFTILMHNPVLSMGPGTMGDLSPIVQEPQLAFAAVGQE